MAAQYDTWQTVQQVRAMGWRNGDGKGLLAGLPERMCGTRVWRLGQWLGQGVSSTSQLEVKGLTS